MSYKEKIDFKLREFIQSNIPKSFLIGAGCSYDLPSNLPLGRQMMEVLIRHSCSENEIEKLLGLVSSGTLRFEVLIEIIQTQLDNKLNFIDYYTESKNPNLQHYFLIDMLKKGHFIMTTNFDLLLEYALLKSEIPRENIKNVITPEDFKKYGDPAALFKKGVFTVYKLHGSTCNIIKSPPEDTRPSLIATLRAFGKNKERANIFAFEEFKQPSFQNITRGRVLVVMGYSGWDDFDILPTLMTLLELTGIIWLNHDLEKVVPESFRIISDSTYDRGELDRLDKILIDLKHKLPNIEIYRVDLNTTLFVQSIQFSHPPIEVQESLQPLQTWLKKQIKAAGRFQKIQIPFEIYRSCLHNEEARSCAEELLKLVQNILQTEENLLWLSTAHQDLGGLDLDQKFYQSALEHYEECYRIDTQIGATQKLAYTLNALGGIYSETGNYDKALEKYSEAYKLDLQHADLDGQATRLANMAAIHRIKGNFTNAIDLIERALEKDDLVGKPLKKASRLLTAVEIYLVANKYTKIESYIETALGIAERLRNWNLQIRALRNRAEFLLRTKSGTIAQENALKDYERSLELARRWKVSHKEATLLEALCLADIGGIWLLRGQKSASKDALERAEKYIKESDTLLREFPNSQDKADNYSKLGIIYFLRRRFRKAIFQFKRALHLYQELGEKPRTANILQNLGVSSAKIKSRKQAETYLTEALLLYQEIGRLDYVAQVEDILNLLKEGGPIDKVQLRLGM